MEPQYIKSFLLGLRTQSEQNKCSSLLSVTECSSSVIWTSACQFLYKGHVKIVEDSLLQKYMGSGKVSLFTPISQCLICNLAHSVDFRNTYSAKELFSRMISYLRIFLKKVNGTKIKQIKKYGQEQDL